ncbi:helix-turn-helix domain-containing protein [Pseudovibrio flavus]|uniref:helix-turn-helix domain-containing protein n=1 Tax=Pseudovibrio flavus TaxID=2529854 RepID=UPI00211CA5D7|nr:helix-turn-helix domain-containing protein [Pseudovibrio flavus]
MSLETLKEAALRTIFSEKRIRSWISKGQIQYVKLDGTYYLKPDAIDELIERNTVEPCQDLLKPLTSSNEKTVRSSSLGTDAMKQEKGVNSQQALRTALKLRGSSKTFSEKGDHSGQDNQ